MTTGLGITSEVERTPGHLTLTLTGALDEHAVLPSLDWTGIVKVNIDLHGVYRCNSMGLLRWGRFMKSLPTTLAIRLTNCSTTLVKHMNLFISFLGHPGLEVESFYVTYSCPGCGNGTDVLMRSDELAVIGLQAVTKNGACAACKTELELEEWPDKQFLFLIRNGKVSAV